MTSYVLNPPLSTRAVQITGVFINPTEPLTYSLKIELKIDAISAGSVFVNKKEKSAERLLEKGPFDFCGGSILTVEIQEKHRIRDKTFAPVNLTVEKLILEQDAERSNGQSKMYRLRPEGFKNKIWLNFKLPSPVNPSEAQSSHITKNVLREPEQTVDPLQADLDEAVENLNKFKTILDHIGRGQYLLDTGLQVGAAISQLHPIAGAVLGCLKVAFEKVKDQNKGHEKVLRLAKSMARTVAHVRTIEKIAKLDELKKTLEEFPSLMKETVELIKKLVGQGQFVNLVLTSSNNDEIDKLSDRHATFMDEFDRGIDVDGAVNVAYLTHEAEMNELSKYLRKPNETVKPQAQPCLSGTRAEILAGVAAKVDDLNDTNVIWIKGAPGSGKSSISLSAKASLQNQGRLVKYFRFDRTEADKTTPSALWCQVAYELADRFPSVRKQILPLLRNKKVDQESEILHLFNCLVRDPLLELSESLPNRSLVIIIDALDECGGRDGTSRKVLQETLKCWPTLPKRLKLLVTSREENDIRKVLSSISTIIHIPSGRSLNAQSTTPNCQDASAATTKDIQTFLVHRLTNIRECVESLPSNWPGAKAIDNLVHNAAGNFMWATAVAGFVEGGFPDKRLQIIINNTADLDGLNGLHSLYFTILKSSLGGFGRGDSEMNMLRTVLAIMVFSREPILDIEVTRFPITLTIGEAAGVQITKNDIEFIRSRLSSVIDQGHGPLRFVHKSFDDFLLSDACPTEYRIREGESQLVLTKFCLITMNAELRFNMCNIETSCLKNVNLPDIDAKVKNGISGLLSYSCRFWADHLIHIPFSDDVALEVMMMLYDKLLYWFESLSLLGKMNRVSRGLLSVMDWSKSSSDEGFKAFVQDAHQFIAAFIHPITECAPHIYISALPFAPEYSLVTKHFLPRFPRILSLSMGKQTDWPSCIFTSERHSDEITAISFSPDEKLFISGSQDGTVCVCDSETGNVIFGMFRECHSEVVSVFFRPDGRRFWASHFDGQVIGWEVEKDKAIKCLTFRVVRRHWRTRDSCCFDGGRKIASVSTKRKVMFWNAETGDQLLYDPSNIREFTMPGPSVELSFSPDGGHVAWVGDRAKVLTVRNLVDGSEVDSQHDTLGVASLIIALSFSTEGRHVVSGSEDGSIIVWDAQTAKPVGRPLVIREGRVNAVAYSHAKSLIISAAGSRGTEMMVWNASTHEAIMGPLEGHTSRITIIKLSQDGRRVLSGSRDKTVRMWDLCRNNALGRRRAQDGSTSGWRYVTVAFSPCGQKLASLGPGSVLGVWDVTTGKELVSRTDTGADPSGMRIIISPDGSQIVGYSGNILCTWNTGTGELLFRQCFADSRSGAPRLGFQSTNHQHRLITCSKSGIVRAWCLEDGAATEDTSEPVSSPQPTRSYEPVQIWALSPDGLTAFVSDSYRNPCFYLWSPTTCQLLPLTFLTFLDSSVCASALSPSGLLGISTLIPNKLRVWDIHTQQVIASQALDGACWNLRLSPDNRYVAYSVDASLFVWNIYNGHITTLWNAGAYHINTFSFSGDGTKLVSASGDGQIRLWDTTDLVGGSEPSIGFVGVEENMQDGWMVNDEDKLLFWVPKDHRGGLVLPRNTVVIGGARSPTKLDLTHFKYGEQWAECFDVGDK